MLEEGTMHCRAVSGTTSLFILFLLSSDAASPLLARFQWFRSEPSKAQALNCLVSLPVNGSTWINGTEL